MAKFGSNRRRTLVINPELQKRMVMTLSVAPALGLSAMMLMTVSIPCSYC